ncbi:hypothetical protein AB0F43_31050 [Kribbella sp. NPDC023972]|uniref:hypothetical protein n=1 Tax=Kribbella sp. NPDC023972 TaxID=3154795 RepID=UPI0033DA17C0
MFERLPKLFVGAVDFGGELFDAVAFFGELPIECAEHVLDANDEPGADVCVSLSVMSTGLVGAPVRRMIAYGELSR